jgi:hypothetical protein
MQKTADRGSRSAVVPKLKKAKQVGYQKDTWANTGTIGSALAKTDRSAVMPEFR